jgi:hypothetical protein
MLNPRLPPPPPPQQQIIYIVKEKKKKKKSKKRHRNKSTTDDDNDSDEGTSQPKRSRNETTEILTVLSKILLSTQYRFNFLRTFILKIIHGNY